MKAIISITALAMAMAFSSVSAHELRGGPVVSPYLIFLVEVSLTLQNIRTLNSFTSPTTVCPTLILGGGG